MATETVTQEHPKTCKPWCLWDTGDADKWHIRCNVEHATLRGFNADGRTPDELKNGVTFMGDDGHEWTFYSEPMHSCMERPRTPEERTARIDESNSGSCYGWFSADRVLACRTIAMEVWKLAYQMEPEKPMSRRYRRDLKKRLTAMAMLQKKMLHQRKLNMADVRAEAEAFGVTLVQPYWED